MDKKEIFGSQSEQSEKFKIETIQTPEGNEVGFSAERGGIITSLRLSGRELLYMDEETFNDPSKSVKGGIPILFPNAGPIGGSEKYPLKQHGFARTSSAWVSEKGSDKRGFSAELAANEESLATYPHEFNFRITGKLEESGAFVFMQKIVNTGKDDIPVAMGLHPYFKVPQELKAKIKFDFPSGEVIEENVGKWANGEAISIDNPKVKDPNAVMRITLPGIGTIVLDASSEYKKIWVWSLPGKDFVCVEPVMRDSGGFLKDPYIIKPNEILKLGMGVRFEPISQKQ